MSRTFPGLREFFLGAIMHIKIFPSGCSSLSFKKNFITWVYIFPGPPIISKDFPVLENSRLKFKYFPRFPGPVRTLWIRVFKPRPAISSQQQDCTAGNYIFNSWLNYKQEWEVFFALWPAIFCMLPLSQMKPWNQLPVLQSTCLPL